MSKKLIFAMLSLCLIFGMSVYADENGMPPQMPQSESRTDNRGDRQAPPQGDMQNDVQDNNNGEMQSSDENDGRRERSFPQDGENGAPPQMPQGESRTDNRSDRQAPPQGDMQNDVQDNNDGEMQSSDENDGRRERSFPQDGENGHSENPMMGGAGRRGGDMPVNADEAQETQQTGLLGFIESYSTPIFSIILLIISFIFVLLYKRRQY